MSGISKPKVGLVFNNRYDGQRTDGSEFETYGRCVIVSMNSKVINYQTLDHVVDPVNGTIWGRPASGTEDALGGSISTNGWGYMIESGRIKEVELMPLNTVVEYFLTGKTLFTGVIESHDHNTDNKPYVIRATYKGTEQLFYAHENQIRKA